MSLDGDDELRQGGLSRRRLLASLGGIGTVGMASGLVTSAYLTDHETLANNAFRAGEVELTVDGSVTDGLLAVDFDGIDRGSSGRERLSVGVRTNPVRIWIGTACPDPDDALADVLEIDLRVDGQSLTGGFQTLADLGRDLVDGERIDDACLDPDDTLTLDVNWRLPESAPDELAGSATVFSFQLYAEQCRHVAEEEATTSNPFAGRVCEGPACVPCADENDVKVGTLTLRYLGEDPATVVVVGTAGGAGGVGNGGTELFAGPVESGGTFVVDGANSPTNSDPNWIGPNIYVDDGAGESEPLESGSVGSSGNNSSVAGNNGGSGGGQGGNTPTGVKIHTSCSVPLAPGDVYGDFEIVAGTTTDGEPLCGSEEN